MRKLILIVLATVLMAGNAFGLSVSVQYNTAISDDTIPLAYATTGATMGSMSVTAFFSGASGVTGAWSGDGGAGGLASIDGVHLSEAGDTFGGMWQLVNGSQSILTRLIIDAGSGNSVFDVISNPNHSPGSARGWGFTVASASGFAGITATYSGAVTVDGKFYGDLFRYLTLDFSGGFGSQSTLAFIADTDNVRDLAGTTNIHNPSNAPEIVPEPSTVVLLGCGFVAGLLMYRRKRME